MNKVSQEEIKRELQQLLKLIDEKGEDIKLNVTKTTLIERSYDGPEEGYWIARPIDKNRFFLTIQFDAERSGSE